MCLRHWDLDPNTPTYKFVFSFRGQPDDHVWSKHVAVLWTKYIFVCWTNLFCLFENPHRLMAISGVLNKPAFERLTPPQGWNSSLLWVWNLGRLDIESDQNPDNGDGVSLWNGGLCGPTGVAFNPRECYCMFEYFWLLALDLIWKGN